MVPANDDSPIDDLAYLSRSDHRVTTLAALTVRPRSRSELWEITGVSSSTIRRTLKEFEKRGWIRKDGYQYETTRLGSFVASGVVELLDRFDTERQLRDVWEWLPAESTGFSVEMCTDAEVTVADAANPYRPINRFVELLQTTDHFRFAGFDVALLEPCKEDLCQQVIDGMKAEFINPPRVVNYIRSTCPDLFSDALDSGNLEVRLHDDLPSYGVSILDDRIAISGYDPESVTVRVLLDTDDTDAREWAESVYESYRHATPTLPLETTHDEPAQPTG